MNEGEFIMADNAPAAKAQTETVSQAPTFLPPADIYETKDTVVMMLEMPGADPQSLNVTLDKRILTITASAKSFAPQGYTQVHAEYEDGNYERVFTLSELVDGDHIDAEFKNGVLRVTLPKTTPSPAKKINVRAA
jgi:HSP20 family molecular chaperone IbpA